MTTYHFLKQAITECGYTPLGVRVKDGHIYTVRATIPDNESCYMDWDYVAEFDVDTDKELPFEMITRSTFVGLDGKTALDNILDKFWELRGAQKNKDKVYVVCAFGGPQIDLRDPGIPPVEKVFKNKEDADAFCKTLNAQDSYGAIFDDDGEFVEIEEGCESECVFYLVIERFVE